MNLNCVTKKDSLLTGQLDIKV